jgi:hypothetical protein
MDCCHRKDIVDIAAVKQLLNHYKQPNKNCKMKKSDIIEITIKILGLYLFINVITSLKDLFTLILTLDSMSKNFTDSASTNGIITMIIGIVIYILVLVAFATFLTFGTKTITKRICRQVDYEENITLLTDKKTFYEIAFVIIGGVVVIWTIPELLIRLLFYTKSAQNFMLRDSDKSFLFLAIIKIVLGIVAIIYADRVAARLTKEKK